MSPPPGADAVRRRFVGLTALRWLATGFVMPVGVLLQLDRGLTLAQVGVVAATQGVVVMLLEMPTGGLADALGRRPVLLVASALDVAFLAIVAVAGSPGAFMAAWAVQGVYRALDSGPLEAWFVDATHASGEGASVERGLTQASTALSLAIAAGALGAAGLVAWAPGGANPLVVPVVVALVLRVADAAAIARWLVEPPRPASRAAPRPAGAPEAARASTALAAGLREAGTVLRSTVSLLATSRPLLALVAVELFWGAGLSAVEMLGGPRLEGLVGDVDGGAVALAVAMALGWLACAAGSAATGRIRRAVGGGPARAGWVLRVTQGLAAMGLAVIAGPAGFLAAYTAFYLVHGASNVVHYTMVHELVDESRRTTVLSAHSLAAQGGGALAVVALGRLATGAGPAAALGVAAVLVGIGAPLYLVAARGTAGRPAPVAPAGAQVDTG